MDQTQITAEEAARLLAAARGAVDWFLFDGAVGTADEAMRSLVLAVGQIDARTANGTLEGQIRQSLTAEGLIEP